MLTFKQYLQEAVKLANDWKKSGKISQEDYNYLLSVDPTDATTSKPKVYMDWLVRLYVAQNKKKFEPTLKDTLSTYHDLYTRKVIKPSIDTIKTLEQLKELVTNNTDKTSNREVKNQKIGSNVKIKGLIEGEDYDILKDTPKYIAYGVYNHKASVIIGKDSGWCTTMTEPTHWNHYTKNGNHFIYIIDKKNLSQVEVRKPKNPNDKVKFKGVRNPVRWNNFDDKFLDPTLDTWTIYIKDNVLKYVDKGDNTTNEAPTKFISNIGLTEDHIMELFRKHKMTAQIIHKENLKKIIRESPVDADLNHLDLSNVTDMSDLFKGTKFNGDISKWDVSHVTNMSYMFTVSQFNGDISKWDVSNVANMSDMFAGSQFNGDISKWDVSNVANMGDMFTESRFNGNISKWDVSNVKDMSYMFAGSQFNGDISKWDVSNAITNRMFTDSPLESKYGKNGENLKK